MPIITKPLSAELFTASDIERFHQSYLKAAESNCWNWQRKSLDEGYGVFRTGHSRNKSVQKYKATRLAFFLANHVDPGEQLVCHTCDNRLCCNPKHLFLGNNAANMFDMVAKGRSARNAGNNKLSPADALLVRADPRPYAQICAEWGISKSTVSYIKNNKTWREDRPPTHITNL